MFNDRMFSRAIHRTNNLENTQKIYTINTSSSVHSEQVY